MIIIMIMIALGANNDNREPSNQSNFNCDTSDDNNDNDNEEPTNQSNFKCDRSYDKNGHYTAHRAVVRSVSSY